VRELFKRWVAGVFSEDFLTRMMYAIGKAAGLKRGRHFTHHSRPLRAADSLGWSDPIPRDYRVAIVVQGPVIWKDDLTVETLKCYAEKVPHAEVILSTWESEDVARVRSMVPNGIHIVLNQKPAVAGVLNINFQLRSTLGGVRRARELGADFVLKTRTDTRVHNPLACDFLVALLSEFPLDSGLAKVQRHRIISTNHSKKYVPYFVSDQLVFGHIEDMLKYWEAPEDSRQTVPSVESPTVRREYLDRRVPEIYLVSSFLNRLGIKPEWTMAAGWRVYARHFCIVDCAMLDFVWYKYASHLEYPQTRVEGKMVLDPLTFAEWLILRQSVEKRTFPSERLLDLSVFGDVPRDIFDS